MKKMTNIKTDKVIVESGTDFTFVCRKIPFSISCSELHQGKTNLIDLDLINKMKIPLRNIRVTRMSLLGHDVRAVGRIKQTVQCVVNGRVEGNVHLEGKVVRDLYSLLGVDCLASTKTYERLLGRKPPDPLDEGYDSPEEIPTLGGDEENQDDDEDDSNTEDHQETEEEVPPDPPDSEKPSDQHPRPTLNSFQHPEWPNFHVFETQDKEESINNAQSTQERSDNLYSHLRKFGPGPRDLYEMQLNNKEDDGDDDEQHCNLCFREGKSIKVVTNHDDNCPTCPSLTPNQKLRIHGQYWKQHAEMIFKMRFNKEKGRE